MLVIPIEVLNEETSEYFVLIGPNKYEFKKALRNDFPDMANDFGAGSGNATVHIINNSSAYDYVMKKIELGDFNFIGEFFTNKKRYEAYRINNTEFNQLAYFYNHSNKNYKFIL